MSYLNSQLHTLLGSFNAFNVKLVGFVDAPISQQTNELVPLGIGYSVVLIAFYVDLYYNVIIAWAMHFFIKSFTSELPWAKCNNPWNTDKCFEISDNMQELPDNATQRIRNSAALEYFK